MRHFMTPPRPQESMQCSGRYTRLESKTPSFNPGSGMYSLCLGKLFTLCEPHSSQSVTFTSVSLTAYMRELM